MKIVLNCVREMTLLKAYSVRYRPLPLDRGHGRAHYMNALDHVLALFMRSLMHAVFYTFTASYQR